MTQVTEIPLAAIVDHPDQPRYGVGDIEALAESIAAVGQLEPIIVIPVSGSQVTAKEWYVLSGHRRVAALRHHKQETVKAVPLYGLERVAAVQAIMASNTAREALTPLEEARGYQTMIELGIKVDVVARIAGAKKKHVDRLSKAIKQLGRTRSDELAAKEPQLSIEAMEGLSQFAGDEKRYGELVEKLGSPAFDYTLREFTWRMKDEQRREQALAKLREEGVTIVEGFPEGGAYLHELAGADGKAMSDEEHASCPGHAAMLRYDGAPSYICSDWKANGHERRDLAYGRESDEWKRQRAEREAREAALEETAASRRAYVSGLLQREAPHGGLHYLAVKSWWDNEDAWIDDATRLLALELLGWEFDDTGKRRWVQSNPGDLPANASGEDLVRAFSALFIASLETECRHWRADGDDVAAISYLRLLKGEGYELTESEHAIAWPPKEDQPETDEEPEPAPADAAGEGDDSYNYVDLVYPDAKADASNPVEVGPSTQYATLICGYLNESGQGDADPEDWRVVAERELADPMLEYGRREPHEIVCPDDYGQRLRIVAADQGSVHGS